MRLDVDIGNSRLKWRLNGQGAAVATDQPDWIESVLEAGAGIDAVYVGSVAAPEVNRALVHACQSRLGLTPQFAEVTQGFQGLQLAYENPSLFGVDRWLALLAARHRFPAQPIAVVSAGTALTVDLVDADGQHTGGYIVPGLGLATGALLGRAARLKGQEIVLHDHPRAGSSTQACLAAGFSAMYQEFLRYTLETAPENSPRVNVLTGGDADHLLPLTGFLAERHLVPELVLAGLVQVFPG